LMFEQISVQFPHAEDVRLILQLARWQRETFRNLKAGTATKDAQQVSQLGQ
jgi:hypothetical protein